MSFHRALAIVFENEGGYQSPEEAERRGDPGGATNFGITEVTLRSLGLDPRPELLTPHDCEEIYREHYWRPVRAISIVSEALTLAAFDFGVQSGPRRAIRTIQKIVGTEPDGILGGATARAIHRYGVVPAILDLSAARRTFLLRWVLARPRRLTLLRGVMARVDRVERAAVQWAIDERPSQPADVLWRGYHRFPNGR